MLKKKNLINKNQVWNPSINSTRQKRTQLNITQKKKKKTKANNQQKSNKHLMQRGFMLMK
jgi:hypothetical protein